jgi:hypothetical protein
MHLSRSRSCPGRRGRGGLGRIEDPPKTSESFGQTASAVRHITAETNCETQIPRIISRPLCSWALQLQSHERSMGAFSGPSGVPANGEESNCWLSYKGLHVKSEIAAVPHGRFGSDLSTPPQPDTVIAALWLHLMFESAPPGIGMAHFSQPCANTPNIEWQRPRWSRNPLHNRKHDLETRPLTRHKRWLLVAPNGTVQEIKGQDRGRELVSLANRPCWFANKIDLSRTDGYSLFGLVA